MRLGGIGTSQNEYVVICNFLLLVGQLKELLVYLVQTLLALDIAPVDMQTVFQGRPTRPCCQHYGVVVESNVLRVHNLVCLNILQHAILMYAA